MSDPDIEIRPLRGDWEVSERGEHLVFRPLHSPSRMVAVGRFYGAAKFAFMMLRANLMKSSQTRPKGNEQSGATRAQSGSRRKRQ